MAQAFRLEF